MRTPDPVMRITDSDPAQRCSGVIVAAMSDLSAPRVLNDGRSIPPIGLGTYGMIGEPGIHTIVRALDAGYRMLDTATKYDNEREVGAAVRRSAIDRSEIVVTSKLPGRYHGYEKALQGFEVSRANLGLDYIDLYLIHWPLPRLDLYVDTWRALISLQSEGLIRSIGVSNFTQQNLTRLIAETGVTPAVNQIELHPYFPQVALREVNRSLGILTQSWSPLAEGRELGRERAVASAATAHGVSAAQVALRWNVQVGAVPVPRSANDQRQRQNLDLFGFELSSAEMEAISSLGRGRLWGADPDTYESF